MAKEKDIAEEIVDSINDKHDIGEFVLCGPSWTRFAYSSSVTEQIHHASIAEQVRAGQGAVTSPEEDSGYYDFPDGKDDGSDGVGIFDLSEPSEAFEAEASFKRDLGRDVSHQVYSQSVKSAKSASNKKAQTSQSNETSASDSSETPDPK